MKGFGVGIIGASATRGWASNSHVPAVKALSGLELVAVASGDEEKAKAAATAFGAGGGYANGLDLIRDPAVDIVAIVVKVPDHRDLFTAAVAERKHIYCEWPLGRNLAESCEMAEAAEAAGVHVAVGLQTRANPAARQARFLIESGAIGRVLSARIVSTTAAFGKEIENAMAFAEELPNGVTLATIQGAHSLDISIAILGPYSALDALTSTQFPQVAIGDPARWVKRTIPDHMLVQARLAEGGGVVSIEVAGGRPPEEVTFQFDISGEKGRLSLVGGAVRGFQSGRLTLFLNGVRQSVDEGRLASLPDEALNVAGLYEGLRNDIANQTWTVPSCEQAVRTARLIDHVLASSTEGVRKEASGWPMC